MKKLGNFVIVTLEILILWEITSILLNKSCLPRPLICIKTCINMLMLGELTVHILASLNRIASGLLFGTVLAVPFGLILGHSKKADKYIGGIFNLLYVIPKVVLLPVIIVVMGIGDLPKIFLIAMVIFFQETVIIRDASRSVPEEVLRYATSLGAGKWQKFRYIIWPKCIPEIITSLRASLGTAIALLFITENFASISGLGYYITNAMNQRNYSRMYSAIIMLSLLGIVIYHFFNIFERFFCKWKFKKVLKMEDNR